MSYFLLKKSVSPKNNLILKIYFVRDIIRSGYGSRACHQDRKFGQPRRDKVKIAEN